MDIAAVGLLGFFAVGYFVLAGADIGLTIPIRALTISVARACPIRQTRLRAPPPAGAPVSRHPLG